MLSVNGVSVDFGSEKNREKNARTLRGPGQWASWSWLDPVTETDMLQLGCQE